MSSTLLDSAPLEIKRRTKPKRQLLFSIGVHTDRALDLLGFSDKYIHYLYVVVTTVRSSRWAEVLQGSEFGLTPHHAAIVLGALFEDVKAAREQLMKVF